MKKGAGAAALLLALLIGIGAFISGTTAQLICSPSSPPLAAAAMAGDGSDCRPTHNPFEKVWTSDARLTMRCVAAKWSQITTIGTYPRHQPDEAHALDVMIPDFESAGGRQLGSSIADWVRAHHAQLGVQYVIYYGRIWSVERGREGWRPYFAADSPDPSKSHHNHVHVSVYGDKATGFPAAGGQVAIQVAANAAAGSDDTPVKPTGSTLRDTQIANARSVEKGVRALGGSPYVVFVALVAAVGESDLISLDHGDAAGPDSKGLFQARDNWGTRDERLNPVIATKLFLRGPHMKGGGLLDVRGGQQMTISHWIHASQVNTDPEYYTHVEGRAKEFAAAGGVTYSLTPNGPSVTGAAAAAGPADTVPDKCCPPAGAGGQVPLPTQDPKQPLDLTVATWNTRAGNSTANVADGVRRLGTAGAGVVGLQEVSTRKKRQALRKALPGWTFTKAEVSTPIGWRTRQFKLLDQGAILEFGFNRIEAGASGTTIGPRSFQWVTLRDKKTGAVFSVGNDHKVPSIDRGGRPDTDKPRRLALYDTQMAVSLAKLDQLSRRGPVFKAGDDNVAALADAQAHDARFPAARMADHGLSSNWRVLGYPTSGTEQGGSRLIDSVWTVTAQAAPTAQRVLGTSGSDHRAVAVTLTNRKAAAAAIAPASLTTADTTGGTGPDASCGAADAADVMLSSGGCPLNKDFAPGHKPRRDCTAALDWAQQQMLSGPPIWGRQCLAAVARAYGYGGSGYDTAYLAAVGAKAAGKLHTDRTHIPRGALLYWDGSANGNTAGHVAIYDGEGHIYSNDVKRPGHIDRVPWTYPETEWHQTWLGWAPPYFPNAA